MPAYPQPHLYVGQHVEHVRTLRKAVVADNRFVRSHGRLLLFFDEYRHDSGRWERRWENRASWMWRPQPPLWLGTQHVGFQSWQNLPHDFWYPGAPWERDHHKDFYGEQDWWKNPGESFNAQQDWTYGDGQQESRRLQSPSHALLSEAQWNASVTASRPSWFVGDSSGTSHSTQ